MVAKIKKLFFYQKNLKFIFFQKYSYTAYIELYVFKKLDQNLDLNTAKMPI